MTSKYAAQAKYHASHPELSRVWNLHASMRKGRIPLMSTLKKYGISLDEVNKYRATQYLLPLIKNPAGTRLIIADPIDPFLSPEGKGLPPEVKEPEATITLKTINDFFLDKAISGTGGRTQTTVNSYIKLWGSIFHKLSGTEAQDYDIVPFITQKLISPLIADAASPNTKRNILNALTIITTEHPLIVPRISEEDRKYIATEFKRAIDESAAVAAVKAHMPIPPFSEIMARVLSTVSPNSREALIMHLYSEFDVRDDFGNVLLIEDASQATDPNQNYMVLVPHVIFILRAYKTARTYGEQTLTAKSTKIYEILMAQLKTPGKLLVAKNDDTPYATGTLSRLVTTMIDKAGISGYGDSRGVRLLRASKESEALAHCSSPKEWLDAAKAATHGAAVQMQYVRPLCSLEVSSILPTSEDKQ